MRRAATLQYRELRRNGRWYAEQQDGPRERRSAESYSTREDLCCALAFGTHRWTEQWDEYDRRPPGPSAA